MLYEVITDMFTPAMVSKTIENLGIKVTESADIKENPLYDGGKVRKFDRPFLVRLVRSSGIKLSQIHLRQPAARITSYNVCYTKLLR